MKIEERKRGIGHARGHGHEREENPSFFRARVRARLSSFC